MTKTGKRVDVVRAFHNHPSDDYMDCGVPILHTAKKGTRAVSFMAKDVVCTTPTHNCSDWARDSATGFTSMKAESVATDGGEPEYIYRYDESGDQICTNCGHVRNGSQPDTVHDHQHAGRYDGYESA